MKLILICSLLIIGSIANAKAPREVDLTPGNTVVFAQQIDAVSIDGLVGTITTKRMFLPPEETLYLLVMSGGGQYDAGLEFMAVLKQIPNVHIICKYCASAAGTIFTTAAKGTRLVFEKSIMLMHEMRIENVTAAIANDGISINSLKRNSDIFNKMHYDILGISKEAYEKKIIGKEWVVKGEEIVKLKLGDEFIKINCHPYIKRLTPDTCTPE